MATHLRDRVTFRQWFRGFWGFRCQSHLNYKGKRYECHKISGHKEKHADGPAFERHTLSWGYGDNWLNL